MKARNVKITSTASYKLQLEAQSGRSWIRIFKSKEWITKIIPNKVLRRIAQRNDHLTHWLDGSLEKNDGIELYFISIHLIEQSSLSVFGVFIECSYAN